MARIPTLSSWYTCTEASAILDCTRANILDLIKRDKLPHATLRGNIFFIPKMDIDARLKIMQRVKNRRGRKRKSEKQLAA